MVVLIWLVCVFITMYKYKYKLIKFLPCCILFCWKALLRIQLCYFVTTTNLDAFMYIYNDKLYVLCKVVAHNKTDYPRV